MTDYSGTEAVRLDNFESQFYQNEMQTEPEFADIIPLTSNNMELPPFPINALPDTIREYVKTVSEETQTAIDMAAVAAIAALCICVQGKWRIMGKFGHYEPLNLYTLVIADPAQRKSQVQNLIAKPLRDYEKQKNIEIFPEVSKYQAELDFKKSELLGLMKKADKDKNGEIKEQVINAKLEIAELENNPVKPLKLYTDDVTPEQLVTLCYENKERMAIISAEGGIFGTLSGRYSNGIANIEAILHMHACEPVRVERRGRSENMDNPALTMMLSVQPLQNLYTDISLTPLSFQCRTKKIPTGNSVSMNKRITLQYMIQ